MHRSTDFVPKRLQAQLLAAGVPAWKHTEEGLLSLFPREMNVGANSLEADDLADVVIYFAARGLLGLDEADAGSSIKKVEPGWHFCQFYRDDAQLLGMIAPYIAEGLENGEGCFWVLPTSTTFEGACDALAQSVSDVDAYLASGRLELGLHPDWYLDESGRLKSFEEISGALLEKQDRALSNGLRFLRAAGDTGWVSGTEQSKHFIDYEMKVNAALGQTKVAAVCTFRAGVTADELVEIVASHQNALRCA
jgi:hypothetical protein